MNPYNHIKAIFILITSAKFKYIYAGIRRRFIFYFRKGYFNSQIGKRKGKCLGLGHCCKKTFYCCAYFKNGLCSIYDKKPFFCRVFPIDQTDMELSDVSGICGYNFK
jgi:hypothetical protein